MIKGSIHQNVAIKKTHRQHRSTCIYQANIDLKGEVDKCSIIVGNLSTLLSAIDRSFRWEISGETLNLKLTLEQMNITDIYRTFYSIAVHYTARRSNQSILKEVSPMCSLVWLILKLKLQYFGHLLQRVDSLEKILVLGKIGGRRRRGRQRMRWLDGITDSMDMDFSRLPELVMDREAWHAVIHERVGHNWVAELNWTLHTLLKCTLNILQVRSYDRTQDTS